MGAFSALLGPLWGESTWWCPEGSPHKGTPMWSFAVSIVVILNKLLNKQSSCQWFDTPWGSCDVTAMERKAFVLLSTESKMSFWGNCLHWLHQIWSFWQFSVTKISSKWQQFRFSAYHCGKNITLELGHVIHLPAFARVESSVIQVIITWFTQSQWSNPDDHG